jgi:hypothetical protein
MTDRSGRAFCGPRIASCGLGFGWPLLPALFLPGICARAGRVGVVDVGEAR